MRLRHYLLGSLASFTVGCFAPVGVSALSIPPDAANQCRMQCRTIGMDLSAVAIMANNLGCVCQPSGGDASAASAAANAGMVTIMLQEEEEQRQRQQQQQQQART